MITLSEATLGAQAYEAFSAMLRVNPCLVLKHTPFETAGADEKLRESHKHMVIEQRLNKVDRGRLMVSRQTTKEEWVYDSDAFQVSYLYSLLRLDPTRPLFAYRNLIEYDTTTSV
jgi:hypothetical protein